MIFNHKKYYFNPVTLSFEEIKINKNHRIRILIGWSLIALLFTAISGFVFNRIFDSQESRMLERDISALNRQMVYLAEKGQELSAQLKNEIFVMDNTYRIILELDTLPNSMRLAGKGGSAADREMARHQDISYQVSEMISSLTSQLQIQSGSFNALYEKAMDYSAEQSHMPAIQPVAKNDLIMISNDFGIRTDPFFFVEARHHGLDFVAPAGKNVYATGDGIVTFVRYSRTGYGNEIVIDHRFRFGSRYAHLETIKVHEGEQVKRGQVIGTVGETGRATGPHLHYEVLHENAPVNPSFYFDTSLTKEEYAQIINKANTGVN